MTEQNERSGRMEAFTFGEPVPVLDRSDLLDYTESWWNGEWYEPPVSFSGLAKTLRAAVHHGSAIHLKKNILTSTFIPHPALGKQDFARWALDYLVFGNAYLEPVNNRLGRLLQARPALAKFVRRGREDRYWWVPNLLEKQEFGGGLVHLLDPDVNQEMYGVPEYLAGMHSVWLNESATLFRRKYYLNGSHAGFILYINDASHDDQDIKSIRTALKESKGPGNFKNLFLYAPNGKKDGVQVIPIAEVMARDEFLNIKNVTRDDQLSVHRIPPQLMGIIPQSGAAFGDAGTATQVWAMNELAPLQERMTQVNDLIGEEIIRFNPYTPIKEDSK